MAAVETLLASAIEWSVRATGTGATVTASKAAGGVGFRQYVFGVSVSTSAVPVASVEAQVRKDSGATILDGWRLSVNFTLPLVVDYNTHPFESSDNGDIDITIPNPGAGITAVAVLKGTTRSRG